MKGTRIDLWFSGKVHEPGGNIQALSAPGGVPLWVSDVEPGSVHDLTVAREHVLGALCWAASQLDLPTLADGGYAGAGIGVHAPIAQPADGQVLDVDNRTYNSLLRGLRCLGERGFAVLTGRWRSLRHITVSPSRVGDIVKAALRKKYGAMIRLWRNAWEEFIPFLDCDVEIRRGICSTNTIESLNARYRRAIRAGAFPGRVGSDEVSVSCDPQPGPDRHRPHPMDDVLKSRDQRLRHHLR